MLLRPYFSSFLSVSRLAVGLYVLGLFGTSVPVAISAEKQTDSAAGNGVLAKRYPPYPEVWDWLPPGDIKRNQGAASMEMRNAPDGDVLVSFQYQDKSYDQLFFSKKTVQSIESLYGKFRRRDSNQRARLISGKIAWSTGLTSNACYRRVEATLEVTDADRLGVVNPMRKASAEKIALFLLEKPKTFRTNRAAEWCNDGPDFTYWVTILRPENFIALADGTFLAADIDAQAIFRFDESLNTRSPLLGKRIFLVEPKQFWEQFGGAKYGDRVGGSVDWQRFHRDLYQWVLQLQRKRS